MKDERVKIEKRIRLLLLFFILCLIFSGVTSLPIERELEVAATWMKGSGWKSPFADWIMLAHRGVRETNEKFPFIAYGTDWLAFAHLVIAVAFIGPLRDPVRNIWVIQFGIISCVAVLPMAFIAGEARNIPVFWRALDCMFGVVGGFILWRCYWDVRRLEGIIVRS